jgi:methyltransferase-like protein
MATLGALFGMTAPPVRTCRVLELGCGNGANLIPMAESLPKATFTGVDLSPNQIAEGHKITRALGLRNITLTALNLLDITPDFGEFDYIIAHGLYSWVPQHVQDHILAICRHNLAPDGMVYISYNTYPGWHMFSIIRDMMLYHTWDITDPHEQASQAMDFLDFLSTSIPEENDAFRDFLNTYITFLKRKSDQAAENKDAFLIHDELSDVNQPTYFYQFVAHAARHELQYIIESNLPSVMPGNLPAGVGDKVRSMAKNIIDMEQYMDFLRGRTFRETLLCHQHIRLDRHIRPERLSSLHIASRVKPVSPVPDIESLAPEGFRTANSGTITLEHPLSKAAMLYLAQIWPRSAPFSSLANAARTRLKKETDDMGKPSSTMRDEQILASNLLKAFTCNMKLVQLHVAPPHVATATSERPLARALARFQAQRGTEVTNMYHERIRLDKVRRSILPYLDGEHDRPGLLRILAMVEASRDQSSKSGNGGKSIKGDLSAELEQLLRWFERSALLVG